MGFYVGITSVQVTCRTGTVDLVNPTPLFHTAPASPILRLRSHEFVSAVVGMRRAPRNRCRALSNGEKSIFGVHGRAVADRWPKGDGS